MHHLALRAHLFLSYGDHAPEIARLYRSELASIKACGGPDAATLHRLSGTVGLLGDIGLARHLRLAGQARAAGRVVDAKRLMRRAEALAVAIA